MPTVICCLVLVILGETLSPAWGQDYPTNLLHFQVMDEYRPKGLPVILSTNALSTRSPTNVVPLIRFDGVPMITAIKTLAEQGKINFLIDPHYRHWLLGGATDHPGAQIVNLDLRDASVEDAFTAILKPRGFVMLDDPITGISLITRYSHRPYPLDTGLLHMEINGLAGTNGIYCPMAVDDSPVAVQLEHLIGEAGLNIKLSSEVTNDVNWGLYMYTEGTTAKQALCAICKTCEYEIVKDENGEVMIRHRALKHYHHLPIH